jgi:hypothetical protein
MPSVKALIIAALATAVSAYPASIRLSPRQLSYHALTRRQNDNAQQQGLNDFDILQL